MNLSSKQRELIYLSLVAKRNLIETGDASLSRQDAEVIISSQKNSPAMGQIKAKLKVLDESQIQLVKEINELIESFLLP